MPVYTCIESIDRISAPSSTAKRMATSLFPEAVGPKMATTPVRKCSQ